MSQLRFETRGADKLIRQLERMIPSVQKQVKDKMHQITENWVREAKIRVPVETGLLRNSIISEVGRDINGEFYGAVGTNRPYGKYLEFGTDRIAGGRVKSLGMSPHITDSEAVTDWDAQKERGAARQQMPWLRTSFMSIRDDSLRELASIRPI